MSLTVLPLLMAGPMLVVGFMNADFFQLKQADPKFDFTQLTSTLMTLSSL
jgi:hypothetical protein